MGYLWLIVVSRFMTTILNLANAAHTKCRIGNARTKNAAAFNVR